MLVCLRAFRAERNVAIVHAPAIHLMQVTVSDAEDRGLRSRRDAGHAHKILPGIEKGVAFHGKLPFMFTNDALCVARVWKNPPERNVPWTELAAKASDFWNVTIGDGTITRGKEQHHETCIRLREPLDASAMQVTAEVASLRCHRD
jgi:hypothetical protein